MSGDTHDQNTSHHERALLAGLLSGRVPFDDIGEIVQSVDFSIDDHGELFCCVRDIARSGVPLALSTIEAEARSRRILDDLGGHDGLSLLASEGRVTARAASYHAAQVAEAGRKRRLRFALLELAEDCHGDATADSLVQRATAQLRDLSPVRTDDYYLAGEAADAAFQQIQTAWQNSSQVGLPTGLRDLDRHVGGLRPGQMIVLAARPSIGKSCVGAEIAQRVAEAGHSVLFANLEMSKAEMGQRFLSRLSGLPSNLLSQPRKLVDDDIQRLQRARERIAAVPLTLWGGSGRTIDQLASAARRFHARAPLSLLVIDYLGLLRGDGRDRYQQVSAVSQSIKALAMELYLPILTLCQLNRESERTGRPATLADLRDSGAIEQDADMVVFIDRERDSEDCSLRVAKFRNGQLGSVQVRFEGAYSRVSDVDLGQPWQA